MIKPILNKLFWGVFRHFLSDKQYAKFRYWLEFGRVPDIENPERFTEKIQHIKLYQRTELRKLVADRIRVRSYVAEKIGEKHLIPLIGNYDQLTKEVWRTLPEKFVLKANHGCKMNKIVSQKNEEAFQEVQKLTTEWQELDYSSIGREWVYKDLPRTIVVEELLKNAEGKIPKDYKFFCFHGKVELVQVDFDRYENHSRNLYDRDFNLLPVRLVHENYEGNIVKPSQLDQAVMIAETLSADFDFIRVDLFLIKGTVFFGELTNYPANGFQPFTPDSYDFFFGDKLQLDPVIHS
ncbi:hypothetical protein DYD21_17155 [Rhodohalobacter sp. SW132]|uniref:ATP-grasp fold amidoligase family protein n=1 Tax=Rhodohalobacter sp. SW132 TaxID=2293433 RepID=UPI000E26E7B5|nr:ATP-grasp fold amidoligase family protein [Rhodohalobacter sp. SW132]REL24882.1 hypothetical protein DYD21_17155 [Rhodohalobacter sp. SW132]